MPAKRATGAVGRLGEAAAVRFLERRGFRVVARNVRSRLGEIDLVARDGETLVFVEVKARRGAAADAPQVGVDGVKRARLARLAAEYLSRQARAEPACRFDVVAVTLDPDDPVHGPACIRHFPGAFTADGWTG